MLAETKYQPIVLDNYKVPVIAGTTMKVVELAAAHLVYGWSAKELHFQFPDLTRGNAADEKAQIQRADLITLQERRSP
jgi:uncharacterized protein (DUF433 family)